MAGLRVGGGAAAWSRAGFRCDRRGFRAGAIEIAVGAVAGSPGLWLDRPDARLDGAADPVPQGECLPPADHPNGTVGVDHVVVATPDFERSLAAFDADGLRLRRTREAEIGGGPVRQAFYVAGPCLIELVGGIPAAQGAGPAVLWGVTFVTANLGSLPALAPPVTASIEDAVQPGRRIAVARAELGLPLPVAFMDPR